MVRKVKVKEVKSEEKPIRLDLACGNRKTEGFLGVDKEPLKGVDFIQDLESYPYPFEDNSVDEINCFHFIEHTKDLIKFMNEIYRILKVGGKITIVAPYYTSCRAWQDPTHVRAISEFTFLYFNKEWRDKNLLEYYPITADFDFTYGYSLVPEWANREENARTFAIQHYMNVVNDIHVVLTKRQPKEVASTVVIK